MDSNLRNFNNNAKNNEENVERHTATRRVDDEGRKKARTRVRQGCIVTVLSGEEERWGLTKNKIIKK